MIDEAVGGMVAESGADGRGVGGGMVAELAVRRDWLRWVDMEAVRELARLIGDAGRIAALTGAGISTDSGIPDFRGPNGLWTRDPGAASLFAFDRYVADPDVRRRAWRTRREHAAWTARPNSGHRALVDLERAGRLQTIVTQNIDGLHQRAGSVPERVIEVHGTLHEVLCLACGDRTPMRHILDRVEAGEEDPPCALCGGILKSATISFGQSLDAATLRRATTSVAESDLLIAIGTSLRVYPAAGLVDLALGVGARVAIVNAEPTPYDDAAHLVVHGPIGEILPAVVAAVVGSAVGDADRVGLAQESSG